MARTFFGSVSVEDTRKKLEERLKETDALTAERQATSRVSRSTATEDRATTKATVPKSTKKKKKGKVIRVDPNVKPIGRSVLPITAVVESLRSAFERFKSGAKAGASKGKQVAQAIPGKVKEAGAKVKQAAVASAAKPGEKTVVPLTVKPSRNPFVLNTPENVKVVPLKGFEKLAEEQGVPKSQSFNRARGVQVGDQGPLRNALAKRKAAKARKANLGGSRADRSDARSRQRPSLRSASPTPEQKEALAKIPTQQQVKAKKKRETLAGRVVGGVVGAGLGIAAARKFK